MNLLVASIAAPFATGIMRLCCYPSFSVRRAPDRLAHPRFRLAPLAVMVFEGGVPPVTDTKGQLAIGKEQPAKGKKTTGKVLLAKGETAAKGKKGKGKG